MKLCKAEPGWGDCSVGQVSASEARVPQSLSPSAEEVETGGPPGLAGQLLYSKGELKANETQCEERSAVPKGDT